MLELIAKGLAKQGIVQLRSAVFWYLMSKPGGVPQSEIAETFDLEMENANRQALIAGLIFLLLNKGLVHMETTRQGARVYIAAPYLWGRIALIVLGVVFAIFVGVEVWLNLRPAETATDDKPAAITRPADKPAATAPPKGDALPVLTPPAPAAISVKGRTATSVSVKKAVPAPTTVPSPATRSAPSRTESPIVIPIH